MAWTGSNRYRLTDVTAREAVLIEADLLDEGAAATSATSSSRGSVATMEYVVTRDDHFDRVEDLEILTY